jgi:hypothetical protein
MVQLTREALDERRQGWVGLRDQLEKTAERSGELLGRFSAGEGDNLMENVVMRRLGVYQKEIAALGERIKLTDEALAVLSGTAFRRIANHATRRASTGGAMFHRCSSCRSWAAMDRIVQLAVRAALNASR